MENTNLDLAKKVAIEAVQEAGKILMANFGKEKKVSFKGRGDIVTHVDLESEKIIMDLIKKNFPDHSILSEESGFTDNKSEYVWVLDPIDGSMNYYHDLDPFCIGLSLLKGDEILINAVNNPARGYLHSAQKGKGAELNGKLIKVSDDDLENSLVITGLSSKKDVRDRLIPNLEKMYDNGIKIRMFGSGISGLTCVADGSADIFFSIKTNPWDILPAALLVQEAGGKATEIDGKKLTIKSTSILATNGVIHEKMLDLLKGI